MAGRFPRRIKSGIRPTALQESRIKRRLVSAKQLYGRSEAFPRCRESGECLFSLQNGGPPITGLGGGGWRDRRASGAATEG
jgi:hypothetical protein